VIALSVVVTVVEGGSALTRCLEAIASQVGVTALEVIVPYDNTIPEVGQLAERFPTFHFVNIGVVSRDIRRNAFAEHMLYEQRRAAGLRVACGRLVALLEDRGWPQRDWARTMIALHDDPTVAAVGGAIEHGGTGSVRWALFFCDYGRYQVPLEAGDAEYLTDINICYKRDAIERVREIWAASYREATVNWALRRQGCRLLLSPQPVVVERRQEVNLRAVLMERMHWARGFGHVRGQELGSPFRCVVWATAAPLLPFVLFARHLRRQLTKRRHTREFVVAMPAIFMLLAFWSLGEFVGYCEAAVAPGTSAGARP
jgi:hypothetical protein